MPCALSLPIAHFPILCAFTVQAWKRQVNTKALDFAAWGILHGTEPYPGFSADPKTIASWNERRSKLLGYIMSTIDETMADTFFQDISTVDVNDMWLRLIELFEPKQVLAPVPHKTRSRKAGTAMALGFQTVLT
ncbi:hypothetical protein D9611_006262 [Ephemerocybe angulata]|uniref:Uncharacterized protein n=1 Tax=Ephemerocybe angulata TaxID=980116 RepID=A0A8H5FGY7_9AGAR|nr:hypothetical protein D9611_006262 [Tulosesus angulatus]